MLNEPGNLVPPFPMGGFADVNPIDIILDFYWQYPLPETKSRLWSWYIDAVQNEEVNAGDLVLFFDGLMKMIEASHLYWKDIKGY